MNVPTDCPGRERRAWTADAFSVSQAECLNFDMLRMYYKWFDDYGDCQRSFGWIPVELPASTDTSVDVNWPMSSIFIPWDIFQAYGDKVFLIRFFDVMKKYINFLTSISDEDYTINERHLSYGDWVAKVKASKTYLGTAYYYRCAFLMSKIAAEIGKTDDVAVYGELAQKIKESINIRFLKNSSQKTFYDNNSQSANAHALFLDFVPVELKPHVIHSLVEALKADGANNTGFLGTMCLLPALADNGRNDIVFSMVCDPNPGNWIYLVESLGATTFPEDFAGEWSQNHAFLGGSLSAWFYRHLAGIQPLAPGYKKIQIKPYIPSTLINAKAQIHTFCGMVKAGWEKTGDTGLKINITVPPNTIAIVYVPATSSDAVAENGKSANQAKEMKNLGYKDGFAVFEVGSGEYCFIS
jgi:alpha-L-rhamnosidase